jgi:hypothetical protein
LQAQSRFSFGCKPNGPIGENMNGFLIAWIKKSVIALLGQRRDTWQWMRDLSPGQATFLGSLTGSTIGLEVSACVPGAPRAASHQHGDTAEEA